jgi:DNA polymerase III alpha subunit (gram-positive type)
MNYEELRKYCNKKIKEYPQYLKKYKKEIIIAKRFYDNGRDLYQELTDNKEKISHRYVIPFLLGYTNEVLDLPLEMEQVKSGDSGALDVDSDFSGLAKEKVFEYFRKKYGEDCVFHVGTYGTLGLLNAIKDLLRYNEVPFQESNNFTKNIDTDKTWAENLDIIKAEKPKAYEFYEKNKEVLDLVPYFEGKIRQIGSHAGGLVILPKPIYNYIPVERVQDDLVTAWEESGGQPILDKNHIVKLDILGISVLDVIKKTIDVIDEKLFLIEEDCVQKIVPESYIKKKELS